MTDFFASATLIGYLRRVWSLSTALPFPDRTLLLWRRSTACPFRECGPSAPIPVRRSSSSLLRVPSLLECKYSASNPGHGDCHIDSRDLRPSSGTAAARQRLLNASNMLLLGVYRPVARLVMLLFTILALRANRPSRPSSSCKSRPVRTNLRW